MNIFEDYLKKTNDLIYKNQKLLELSNLNNFKNISIESAPVEFNCDLSYNASLVLSKINKINPKDLANKIKELFLNNIPEFRQIEIAGPGFLNIRLSKIALISNIKSKNLRVSKIK